MLYPTFFKEDASLPSSTPMVMPFNAKGLVIMPHRVGYQIFAARCYASAALAVMRCLFVCLSVRLSRLWILSKRINVSS